MSAKKIPPLVSIVLPTYNGAKYISRAIESVKFQDYLNWELLVIIDGSDDNTEDIVKKYQKTDSRIVLIKNEQNIKLVKTLNKGLLIAQGEYIARIDDDDVWIDAHKLSEQIDFLTKNKDYALVGTQFETENENGVSLKKINLPMTDKKIREHLLCYNSFCHSSVVFNKEVAMFVGCYSDILTHAEDWDLWLKIGIKKKFFIINKPMVRYLSRDGLAKQTMKSDHVKNVLKVFYYYMKFYPKKILAIMFLIKYIIIG